MNGQTVIPFVYNILTFTNGFYHAIRFDIEATHQQRPMNEWLDSFIYDEQGNLLRAGTFEIRQSGRGSRLVPFADLDLGGTGSEGPFGLMDENARTVIQPEYDHLSLFSNGFASAIRNGQWYVLQVIEN